MVKGTQEKIINSFFKLAERYPERSSFSITEIANEAKISRQAIYQKHFKSYEEIVDFIMQSIDTTINEQFLLFEEHNLSIEVFFQKLLFQNYINIEIGSAVSTLHLLFLIGEIIYEKDIPAGY